MARHGMLPSLSGLGQAIISPEQLRELGWASAGGAAGFVGASFLIPLTEKIPILDKLPRAVHQAIIGLVGGRLAWRWNPDFAKGLTGGVVGHAIARGIMGVVGMTSNLALADATAVPGSPEDPELAQLPESTVPEVDTQTDVHVDEGDLSELEPSQQFRGLGVAVEAPQTFGWMS